LPPGAAGIANGRACRVRATGIRFTGHGGRRRIDRAVFHVAPAVAIVPMGFCFPGTGRNGDLPPRPECTPGWQPRCPPRRERLRLTPGWRPAGLCGKRRGARPLKPCRPGGSTCRAACDRCPAPARAAGGGSPATRGSNATCCRQGARAADTLAG